MNDKGGSFIKNAHITKHDRFPRMLKEVTRILKRIKTEKKDARTILYSAKLKGQTLRKVHALTFSILKNKKIIDDIIREIDLMNKEPYISIEQAEVMVHEIAVQNKPLPGESKPVLAMQKYNDDISKAFIKHQSDSNCDTYFIPRYARVNNLTTNVSRVIDWFRKHGYRQVQVDHDSSFLNYVNLVKQLASGEFVQDFHFPDVLVFPPNENLSQISLYSKGDIFLQDKASYIPVHVLELPNGSKVLDCCAAPGMKTVHLAGVLQNSGTIIALDRDNERFSTLQLALKHGGVTNCTASCIDFTKVDPNQEPYSSVEYILLDPSCSGSGMTDRLSVDPSDEFSKCPERLEKLAGFQIVLLKHALKFPNVKKIVYSTCSIHEKENEFVIDESLRYYWETFRICNILPEWEIRGSDSYEFGPLCVRAYSDKNLTRGFFVALIERISNQSSSNIDKTSSGQVKCAKIETPQMISLNKKKMKKRKKEYIENEQYIEEFNIEDNHQINENELNIATIKNYKIAEKSKQNKHKMSSTVSESDLNMCVETNKHILENERFKHDNIKNHGISYNTIDTSSIDGEFSKSPEFQKKKSKKHSHDLSEEYISENNASKERSTHNKIKCSDASHNSLNKSQHILKESSESLELKKKSKKHSYNLAEEPISGNETTKEKSQPVCEEFNESLKFKKKRSRKHSYNLSDEHISENEAGKERSSHNKIKSPDILHNSIDKSQPICEESSELLELKRKKKSKKHSHNLAEESISGNETMKEKLHLACKESNESLEFKKKKAKKHSHNLLNEVTRINDENFLNANTNNSTTNYNTFKIDKNSKLESLSFSQGTTDASKNIYEEPNTSLKRKKKKRKSSEHSYEITEEHTNLKCNEYSHDNTEENIQLKKKKKKHRHSNTLNETISTNDQIITKHKKSKKRKKKQ